MNKILPLLLSFLTAGTALFGQSCDSKLEEANRAYYNGEFNTVLTLLEPCAASMSTKELRVEAYSLLSQSAIMIQNDSLAESNALNTLKEDPFYTPKSTSLRLYQQIHENFVIRNYLNLGYSMGFNNSSFSILDYHSYASITDEPTEYESFTGFNLNIWASYFILYDFYLRTGLSYQQHEFFQEEIIFDYQSVSSRETYRYLSIPLQLEYQFSKWKLKPFVNGGFSYHMLTSATADIQNSPLEGGIPNPFAGVTRSLENYDVSDQRTTGNWNLLLGGGLRYQIKHFSFEASIYYENGENNLVDETKRFDDEMLYSDYSYLSDDFKLRQLSFNLGIVYSFLKPIQRQ